ncbi:FHA domain-containing protein [Spirosoma sp. SC4-14]|uniref:FHA domain-containing protein n=1 Tax=Spirosoma sp. SC4-14 TaxID=3128900 RepID=UPI0030CDC3B5
MSGFRTTLINCQQCNRRIMVRASDAQRGSIVCSHVGCGAVNILQTASYYDENLVRGLPGFGQLTYASSPDITYPLQFGKNIIGTSETCTIRVERFLHEGRCFISRRHCTLTVTFDKWTGKLRYQIQDGTTDPSTHEIHTSLNGTLLNEMPLRKTEIIDVDDGGIITLGGADRFILRHFALNPDMLATYRVDLAFNPDRTQ